VGSEIILLTSGSSANDGRLWTSVRASGLAALGAALASAASPEARTLVHNLPSFADEPEVKSIISTFNLGLVSK
jgi:hypothetical protein